MTSAHRVMFGTALASALLVVPAAAQVTNGQIHGRVLDQSGAAVPGVSVTLASDALIRPLADVTTVSGRYEFPIVPIGTYTVTFELTGFKRVERAGVIIQTGFQAEINALLQVGDVAETVEVLGAAPIVDTRRTSLGATFTREVMDQIPTARDPWEIIGMAAGVEANDVNVGGRRSGNQLSFTSRGQGPGNTMWNVEGATTTDMRVLGQSPSYYDFESFQEIQVTTGAGDASIQTSGININLVTRSGSNVFKGSGRIVYSDQRMQWQNVDRELFDLGAGSGAPLKYYREGGGEAGGPIVRNRAWWWFAAARQDISGSVLGFYDRTRPECDPPPAGYENLEATQDCLHPDNIFIFNYNGKLNYQLNASHKFQFLYTYGNKTRNARGANERRAPEAVLRQAGSGPGNFNVRHTWVATDRLVFDTLAVRQQIGYLLTEQPGVRDVQRLTVRDTGFVSRSLFTNAQIHRRPTTEIKTDSSYFWSNVLGGDHATRFGIRYRNTPSSEYVYYPGGAEVWVSSRGFASDGSEPRIDSQGRVRAIGQTCDTCPLTADRARFLRAGNVSMGLWTVGAYIQNNFTRGRLRVNLGARWDYQNDEAKAGCVPANEVIPEILPAQCFDGADPGVSFSDLSPRLSMTYDVLGTGRTVLKGGFARYYGQGLGLAYDLSLLRPVLVSLTNTTTRTCWDDRNGDWFATLDELRLADPQCVAYPRNFDPDTSLTTVSLDEIDPDIKNDRTTELTAGIEHELFPNIALGVNYVRRVYDRFRGGLRKGETRDMWVPRVWNEADFVDAGVDPPSMFGLPETGWIYYEFDPNLVTPSGIVLTQNIDNRRTYDGVDVTVTRRLSGRWMMNLAATVQRRIQDPAFCLDCTNRDKLEGFNDQTLYLIKLNGMYAFPRGWNASANLRIQQGGNRSIFLDGPRTRSGGIDAESGRPLTLSGVNLTAYAFGTVREPLQHLLDAQVTKSFDLRGGQNRLSLIFSVFNVLNANTARGFQNDLNNVNFGNVTSILAPRIARVQASMTF